MTKPESATKKPRKQHMPEFRSEALKRAERIGVAAAAHELSLYESQLYAWRLRRHQLNHRQQFRLACGEAVSKASTERYNLKIRTSLRTMSPLRG